MNEEKLKALDAVLTQIEKAYGKGAIMKLGEQAGNTDIEVIPTGCPHGVPFARSRTRHRRASPRPNDRDLRPRVLR